MDERRKLQRRHLIFYLEIEDEETNEKLGHLGDINVEGMMILTEEELPIEKKYKVRLKLPKFEMFDKEFLSMDIITRWMKKDFNPYINCIGCQYRKLSKDDTQLIERLIRLLGFDN